MGVRQTTSSGNVISESGVAQTVVDSTVDLVVEDWNGDFSAWTPIDMAAISDEYGFNTSVQFEGPQCLEDTHDSADETMKSVPGDGLPNYPAYGSKIRYYARSNTNDLGGAKIYFGVGESASDPPGYEAQFGFSGDVIHLGKHTQISGAGTTQWRDQGSVSPEFVADEWYYGEVIWDDGSFGGTAGDITWTVYDTNDTELSSVTHNDTEYSGNSGVGVSLWSNSTSHTMFQDYIHVFEGNTV